jgi:hypothetical protein
LPPGMRQHSPCDHPPTCRQQWSALTSPTAWHHDRWSCRLARGAAGRRQARGGGARARAAAGGGGAAARRPPGLAIAASKKIRPRMRNSLRAVRGRIGG